VHSHRAASRVAASSRLCTRSPPSRSPSPGCGWAETFGDVNNGTHRFEQADGTVGAPMTACGFVATVLSTLRGRGVNV